MRNHLNVNELGYVKVKRMVRRLDRSAEKTSESELVGLCQSEEDRDATREEGLRTHLKVNDLSWVKAKRMERRLDRSAEKTSESY